MEEKWKKIIGSLHEDLAQEATEEREALEQGGSRGAVVLRRKMDCAHHAALVALSGTARMLALCDHNEEMRSAILSDPDCADLKGLVTHALCELAAISPQMKERVAMAMSNTSVLFNPLNITLYPDELTQ